MMIWMLRGEEKLGDDGEMVMEIRREEEEVEDCMLLEILRNKDLDKVISNGDAETCWRSQEIMM